MARTRNPLGSNAPELLSCSLADDWRTSRAQKQEQPVEPVIRFIADSAANGPF